MTKTASPNRPAQLPRRRRRKSELDALRDRAFALWDRAAASALALEGRILASGAADDADELVEEMLRRFAKFDDIRELVRTAEGEGRTEEAKFFFARLCSIERTIRENRLAAEAGAELHRKQKAIEALIDAAYLSLVNGKQPVDALSIAAVVMRQSEGFEERAVRQTAINYLNQKRVETKGATQE